MTPEEALDVLVNRVSPTEPVATAVALLRAYVTAADPHAPLNARQVREVWARCADVPVENLPAAELMAFLIGIEVHAACCWSEPAQALLHRVLAEFTAYTRLRERWREAQLRVAEADRLDQQRCGAAKGVGREVTHGPCVRRPGHVDRDENAHRDEFGREWM